MPYPLLFSTSRQSPRGPFRLRLGTLCTLEGRGKLRLSHLRVKLQRLVLPHESLELLPHLAHPSLVLLSLGALLGRFIFGLG